MTSPPVCIDALPIEVLALVFGYADTPQLYGNLLLVCHKWNELAKQPAVWKDSALYYRTSTLGIKDGEEYTSYPTQGTHNTYNRQHTAHSTHSTTHHTTHNDT
eukprot:TRINITY_DN2694_c0_g2_i4.p1 TRINITY_DN2694_c0_g2~~TRINITY_DN2694_c0_g2_i4.p1  ORF type:complete len:103 (+),score=19.07 TRINITY_DN2694_c0_g2_i4:47-355(+)